ncbi:MAG: NAD(P)-dependent oxidoreductase [Rhodospirillales bacterium]|nr:NAD(P)-dependent oxidoreductase [Rhodospirillales bacterium]
MTTLITGAGLVGTGYALEAFRRGERVVFIDPEPREDYLSERLGDGDYVLIRDDVMSLAALMEACGQYKPETILHTASLIGGRAANPIHGGFELNLGGVMNVAEAARLSGVKRVVHMSTWGVYDWSRVGDAPVTESAPLGAGSAYSNSKVCQELIFEAYQKKYGFELVMLRPANVFGVGHFWSGSAGGEKVQTLIESGLRGEVARIPEAQTMNFVYLYGNDMGRAVELAATIDLPENPIFNLGYDVVTSFDELVAAAKTAVPDLQVEIIPGTPPVSRSTPLDVRHAAQGLGWTPQYSMEEAFADYARDLKARM